MMRYLILIPFVLFLACSSDDSSQEASPKTLATAEIYTVNLGLGLLYVADEKIGEADFVYQDGVTTMEVNVTMAPNTSHAMHLHMGTLEEPGHHWNQNVLTAFCNVRSLGEVWARPKAGDVGNIDIDAEGNGTFMLSTDLWSIDTGEDSDILGTVLYVHLTSEDFITECDPNHSHSHGHTNAKIAGGTLVIAEQTTEQ